MLVASLVPNADIGTAVMPAPLVKAKALDAIPEIEFRFTEEEVRPAPAPFVPAAGTRVTAAQPVTPASTSSRPVTPTAVIGTFARPVGLRGSTDDCKT